ncbi:MAG: N-acetylmuramoyl-L-alanine amidase [Coriobacteriaceae bacterium]|nr:N-acetylmuramoyl-L-alanine amidase [Coriobacteriaceae bacterium]
MGYGIQSIPASSRTFTRGREGCAIGHIVTHYTGAAGGAVDNGRYFAGGARGASAHYFVDGSAIVQSVADSDTAWAVGNWAANLRTLSIEVCSAGEDFSQGERERLRWLVRTLMERHGIDADHVIRHYDVYDRYRNVGGRWLDPHKCCPAPYAPNGGDPGGAKWRELHDYITGGADGAEETDETSTIGEVEEMAATGLGIIVNPQSAVSAGHPGGLYRLTADRVYHYTNADQPRADDMLSQALCGEPVPRLDMSGYGKDPWFDRMVQARGGWPAVVECPAS